MAKKRVTVQAVVRLRSYEIIESALTGAGAAALRRFYKHRDDEPDNDAIDEMGEVIDSYVMAALSDVLDFGS